MKKLLITIFITSSLIHHPSSIRAAEHRPPLNPARSLFDDPIDTSEPRTIAPYVALRVGGASMRVDGDSHF